jgi:hypothetical protein
VRSVGNILLGTRTDGASRFHQLHQQVRECVFGVLALESEPVDPRL